MTTRRAQCSCAQLAITCTGEPVRISMCHCLACQRRTGSVFAAQARFPRTHVAVEGRAKDYVRIADSGAALTFRFCPECGATVYYTLNAFPDIIAVPIGAFADPDFPPPRFSVYEKRRHKWVAAPEAAERSD